jgi:hypothetical protein
MFGAIAQHVKQDVACIAASCTRAPAAPPRPAAPPAVASTIAASILPAPVSPLCEKFAAGSFLTALVLSFLAPAMPVARLIGVVGSFNSHKILTFVMMRLASSGQCLVLMAACLMRRKSYCVIAIYRYIVSGSVDDMDTHVKLYCYDISLSGLVDLQEAQDRRSRTKFVNENTFASLLLCAFTLRNYFQVSF